MAGVELQLFAQAADMHVHGAGVALIIVAPDQIQQAFAAVNAAGVAHQKLDQVELLHRQLHVLPVLAGAAALGIDADMPAPEHRVLLRRGGHAGAAQQRADARLELQDVEGLGHIVVRAGLKAHQQVCALAAGREHDDRHGGEAADLLAGLQAVLFRHHQIQHDQVVAARAGQLHGLLAVVAGVHGISLVFEVEFDSLDKQALVVDHQYFHDFPRFPDPARSVSSKLSCFFRPQII